MQFMMLPYWIGYLKLFFVIFKLRTDLVIETKYFKLIGKNLLGMSQGSVQVLKLGHYLII